MIGALATGYQQPTGWAAYNNYAAIQQSQQDNNGLTPTQTVNPANAKGKDGGVNNDLAEKYRCRTCAERTYTDGSNDPGVSMKTPTKLDPQSAAAAVTSHEREHVTRNAFKAQAEGREVISSTVTIHSGVCSECGKTYVAGGTTRTVTASKNRGQQQQQQQPEPERRLDRRI